MPLVEVDFYSVKVNDVVVLDEIPYLVTVKKPKKKLLRIEELTDAARGRWMIAANFDRKEFFKLIGGE